MRGLLAGLSERLPWTRRKRPKLPLVTPSDSPREVSRLCFVCGLHRSGTTLLESLLAARCRFMTLRGPVPENEGMFLQDVYPPAFRHGGPGRFAFAPEMHPAPPEPEAAERARARLIACWSPWMVGEGTELLEKSPPNITKIPFLRAVFPGAAFVVIARDPRVVAAATRKWSGQSIEEMVYHWHVAHSAALDGLGEDCHVMTYEALCADPDGEIARACEALSLPLRTTSGEEPRRFAKIRNTNDRYLADLPKRRWGPGAWDRFGYRLD